MAETNLLRLRDVVWRFLEAQGLLPTDAGSLQTVKDFFTGPNSLSDESFETVAKGVLRAYTDSAALMAEQIGEYAPKILAARAAAGVDKAKLTELGNKLRAAQAKLRGIGAKDFDTLTPGQLEAASRKLDPDLVKSLGLEEILGKDYLAQVKAAEFNEAIHAEIKNSLAAAGIDPSKPKVSTSIGVADAEGNIRTDQPVPPNEGTESALASKKEIGRKSPEVQVLSGKDVKGVGSRTKLAKTLETSDGGGEDLDAQMAKITNSKIREEVRSVLKSTKLSANRRLAWLTGALNEKALDAESRAVIQQAIEDTKHEIELGRAAQTPKNTVRPAIVSRVKTAFRTKDTDPKGALAALEAELKDPNLTPSERTFLESQVNELREPAAQFTARQAAERAEKEAARAKQASPQPTTTAAPKAPQVSGAVERATREALKAAAKDPDRGLQMLADELEANPRLTDVDRAHITRVQGVLTMRKTQAAPAAGAAAAGGTPIPPPKPGQGGAGAAPTPTSQTPPTPPGGGTPAKPPPGKPGAPAPSRTGSSMELLGKLGTILGAAYLGSEAGRLVGADARSRQLRSIQAESPAQIMIRMKAEEIRQQRLAQALQAQPDKMAALQRQLEGQEVLRTGRARGTITYGGMPGTGEFQDPQGLLSMLGVQ